LNILANYRFGRTHPAIFITLLAGCFVTLSSCNLLSRPSQGASGPPTPNAGTVQVLLTQVESAMPPSGPASTPTPGSVLTETVSVLPTGTSDCIDQAAFVEDVTIRDNTQLLPGEPFVKIWRLQNAGTCTWTQAYSLTFLGGDLLDASPSVFLPGSVPPGSSIDLSVDMVAPQQPGNYQGFWKLHNPTGKYFGIGPSGDLSFWVKITVPAQETPGSEATASTTVAPSLTTPATTEIEVQGTARLQSGESIDLDNGMAAPSSGGDLGLQSAPGGALRLVAPGNASLALFPKEASPISATTCQKQTVNLDGIELQSLALADRVCYRTDQNRWGYLTVTQLDSGLGFDFVTWAR
jgi:hypothetical protein